MAYTLTIHGISIEASTAEEALELAELYASRKAEAKHSARPRGATRRVVESTTLAPETPPTEPRTKPQSPLLAKLQPMQLEALQAIAAGGKEGLTDEEICAKLGVQGSTLGGILSAISKHARALGIRFEGELIAKDPITTATGKRGNRYLPLEGLSAQLRTLKPE